jgi:hypothetical protein
VLLFFSFFPLVASSKSFDKITIASTVIKHENGYLISIVPKHANVDVTGPAFEGLEKYIEIFKKKRGSGLYVPVEKEDYKFIERKFSFTPNIRITVFSDNDIYIVQGDKYYILIDPLGTDSIQDVCVFIKGDEFPDKRPLIWAKNYEEGDESISLVEDLRRIISDWWAILFTKEAESIARRIHVKILDQLSETKQNILDKSPLSVNFENVNEYKEVIYETKLFPGQRSYVAEVNGKSTFDRISFLLGMILDENLDIKEVLSPFDIQRHWSETLVTTFFKIEHIFYSLELEKDLIIFSELSRQRNGVFLLFERDGRISILRLQPPQYYD